MIMAANVAANLIGAAANVSKVSVRYDPNRRCWVAIDLSSGVRMPEVQARNVLRDYFGDSGLPIPVGL